MDAGRWVRKVIDQGVAAIHVAGPMDSVDRTVNTLAEEMLAEGSNDLLLNMDNVSYLTSAGVSCIVGLVKKVQARKCCLRIRGLTEDMLQLLRLARLDNLVVVQ
jgi:anti-anti-sigma factor